MMSDLIEGVGEEIIWAGLIALSIAIITMAWISTGMPPIEYYVWLVQMQIYPNRRVVQVLHMDHEDAGVLENQLVQRTATMQHNITANVMTTTNQAVTNNTNSGNITEQSQNQLSNAVSSNNDQRSEPSAWSVEQSSTTLPTTHHWEVELGSASSSSSNTDTTENASNRLQQTLRRRALAEQSTGGVDSNVHSESSQSRRLLLSRVRVPLQEEHSTISTPQHESDYDSSAHANDIDSLSSEILASSTSRIEVVERVQDRTTTTTTEAAQEELGQTNDGGSETEARQPQRTSAANTGDIRMNGASNETSTSALIANSSTNLVQDNTRSTNSENIPETILSVSEGLPNSNDNNEKESEKRTARIADENANDKLNSINNDKEKGADESSSSIIRLKFLDDSQMFANTTLDATVGQFKRRYFLEPLGAGKVVRLIYRGQLLRDDTRSLQSYGLHDQCVLHCNISSTPYAQANNNSSNNNNNSSNQMNLGMIPRNAFQESSLQSATAAAIAAIAGTQSVNVEVVAERRTSQNQVPAGQTYRGESIEDNPSQSVALRARNAALRSYRWIHNVVFGLGASDSLNSVGNNGNVNDAVEQAAEAAARGWTAGQREDQPIIGGRLGQSLQFLFIVKFMMLWAFVFFYPQYTDRFSMLLLTLLTLFFATIVFSNRYNRYNS